jgi:hypothetical protein
MAWHAHQVMVAVAPWQKRWHACTHRTHTASTRAAHPQSAPTAPQTFAAPWQLQPCHHARTQDTRTAHLSLKAELREAPIWAAMTPPTPNMVDGGDDCLFLSSGTLRARAARGKRCVPPCQARTRCHLFFFCTRGTRVDSRAAQRGAHFRTVCVPATTGRTRVWCGGRARPGRGLEFRTGGSPANSDCHKRRPIARGAPVH